MYNPFHPPPAAPSFGSGKVLPQEQASLLSRLIFHWLSPFLAVGFSRPLERDDLWELPSKRLTHNITNELESNFFARCPPEKRPHFLTKTPGISTAEQKGSETEMSIPSEKQPPSAEGSKSAQHDSSLGKSILFTFRRSVVITGLLKLCSDTLITTTPLVNKVLLTWLAQSFIYYRANGEERASIPAPRGIGYGIGLAFAIFAMQETASLMLNHFMQRTMANGLLVRSGLIGNIFRKSLRLSGRARTEHSVGKITTMISTDTARLDKFCAFGHILWASPIQFAIGVGLLIGNLGYSALVGLGVLILGLPIQFFLVRILFVQRKKGVKITDSRVRLTNEVLQGVRLIKAYAWEDFYTAAVGNLRKKELNTIRKSAIARSCLIAFVTFVPVLASVLSFITYALSGHDLNVAIVFSSLQLFNIIRQPLMYFPVVLTALSDALVALDRVGSFLTAEELDEPYQVDYKGGSAIEVDGDFTWETVSKLEGPPKPSKPAKGKQKPELSARRENSAAVSDKSDATSGEDKEEGQPFMLKNLKFSIPRGSFVAIVGRVGSGKSSILQALVGEMRRVRGSVTFGGTVAYVPQTSWIRNTTLKENVLFGQEEDDERFQEIISACSLEHDLEMLPEGEETEIGEKGINLSGGQKARVSLARAAYSLSDIILMDDPLSAVDSYVGKEILNNCILKGVMADRTRILVTHALHVLDKVDYIFLVDKGEIREQGTYESLRKESELFSRLMEEYGSLEEQAAKKGDKQEKQEALKPRSLPNTTKKLMQDEERNTGAVSAATYGRYLQFAGGIVWAPIILLLISLAQGAQVGNNLLLGFWTSTSIPGFHQGQYIAVYAGLGAASAVFQFLTSFIFALAGLFASLNLFRAALRAVLRSPVSFFDTTPIGRILSRLSKDQDTLDQELTANLSQFMITFSSVLGTMALVFYVLPYLGIIFVPMVALYYLASLYYRRTSVETKRLDSLMRSALYSSYTETLTGLATIRAYGEQDRAVRDAEQGLDLENRAYYMTITIQRWLGVRLDLLGNILVFGIALFASGFRKTVDPSKIGVVLTYTMSITQVFSTMVTQFAQQEQSMNAVERVLVYSELPAEGTETNPREQPPPSWPDKGEIKFKNVDLAYREGLPLVLENVSFSIRAGEKIGVVGRTGAGKSSLLQALLRLVEIRSGTIEIDSHDTRQVDLACLRGRLALVPQESTLFLGTLRENLDPLGARTDAELISALQRSWLLPKEGPVDPAVEAKFSLDSAVGDEGANFSAGEKQLLALCRASVKGSRIIILDEATSSVDVETDSKIQKTIQAEFATSTLICIAHRLNTIAYYDRILVMDSGNVAEFDTVLNLFDREDSIFRSLCDEANLRRPDILRIRATHQAKTS
ncbi:multidrug resistance-associated ABC transporter [Marasmius fiardii PR-910]|nr:multidrug resistance-associated ABC transporter [Marasmius fiardii PR-910]